MQTPHTIQVEITEDGEVKATVEGISGPQCGPLSEFLNQLGEVVEDEPTPDHYVNAGQSDQVNTGW